MHFDSSDGGCDAQILEDQLKRTQLLTQQVRVMDRKLGISKDYIKYQIRQQKGAGAMMQSTDPDMMDYDYAENHWDMDDHDIMQDMDDD